LKTNYVLVDFENVQPGNMDLLQGGVFRIKVFVGTNQKISVDVAKAIQAFGPDAEYIQIAGAGKNALDFHIAYYIGRLAAESADVHFYIVSKDTGFDPLVRHLEGKKISCQRVASITNIQPAKQDPSKKPAAVPAKKKPIKKTPAAPAKKAPETASIAEKTTAVIKRLNKGTRPATVTRLTSFIKGSFAEQPSSEQVVAIIKELKERKVITIAANGKVDYSTSS
jgi:hypothetical protein